jgi:hypothetical protein
MWAEPSHSKVCVTPKGNARPLYRPGQRGRCLYITGDAEQRAESVERVEAPVKAKREFVEVGL